MAKAPNPADLVAEHTLAGYLLRWMTQHPDSDLTHTLELGNPDLRNALAVLWPQRAGAASDHTVDDGEGGHLANVPLAGCVGTEAFTEATTENDDPDRVAAHAYATGVGIWLERMTKQIGDMAMIGAPTTVIGSVLLELVGQVAKLAEALARDSARAHDRIDETQVKHGQDRASVLKRIDEKTEPHAAAIRELRSLWSDTEDRYVQIANRLDTTERLAKGLDTRANNLNRHAMENTDRWRALDSRTSMLIDRIEQLEEAHDGPAIGQGVPEKGHVVTIDGVTYEVTDSTYNADRGDMLWTHTLEVCPLP